MVSFQSTAASVVGISLLAGGSFTIASTAKAGYKCLIAYEGYVSATKIFDNATKVQESFAKKDHSELFKNTAYLVGNTAQLAQLFFSDNKYIQTAASASLIVETFKDNSEKIHSRIKDLKHLVSVLNTKPEDSHNPKNTLETAANNVYNIAQKYQSDFDFDALRRTNSVSNKSFNEANPVAILLKDIESTAHWNKIHNLINLARNLPILFKSSMKILYFS
jgi:hypothetical protein